MDYKRLIKNSETRRRILECFRFVPDKLMLRVQYFIKQGHRLNLRDPKLYTEKLQWYKLYYRDPLMAQCVDKYDVRGYVEKKGLGFILNECYGVYTDPSEIDFGSLPTSFVLKDTMGGGSRGVIIVKNRDELNIPSVIEQMKKWVRMPVDSPNLGREWPYYSGKKHRIIIEKYLDSNPDDGGLIDYKFFCFNGEPKCLYVIADRKMGQNAGIGIYDVNYSRLPYCRADERPLERDLPKPDNYDEMLTVAKKLSEDFPHVRVDLYSVNGNVIFGETTFFPGSGYMQFLPADFDRILGDAFVLPDRKGL